MSRPSCSIQRWKEARTGYRNADLTVGAADVDNCSSSDGAKVEILDEVVHAVG